MKKIISLLLVTLFAFNAANSQTSVELGLSGDSYWATDNDKSVLDNRQLSNYNIYKDRFGINNALLEAAVSSNNWKARLSLANFGSDAIVPEDANISLRLYEHLWINGGLYAVWDLDYTFNNWFTGNSLTDLRGMASPSLGWGLSYDFKEDMTLGLGMLNSGTEGGFEDINRSKSLYVKLDWANICKDWGITLFGIYGNEAPSYPVGGQVNETYVFLKAGGTIIDKLEAQLNAKLFMSLADYDKAESETAFTAQLLVRYHFTEKFAAGARFAFAADEYKYENDVWSGGLMGIKNTGIDLGIVCEYNPTPFTYLRLEGGMVSLSNSNNEEAAKIFWNGTELVSSRLGLALSMGFKFGLFEREFGGSAH